MPNRAEDSNQTRDEFTEVPLETFYARHLAMLKAIEETLPNLERIANRTLIKAESLVVDQACKVKLWRVSWNLLGNGDGADRALVALVLVGPSVIARCPIFDGSEPNTVKGISGDDISKFCESNSLSFERLKPFFGKYLTVNIAASKNFNTAFVGSRNLKWRYDVYTSPTTTFSEVIEGNLDSLNSLMQRYINILDLIANPDKHNDKSSSESDSHLNIKAQSCASFERRSRDERWRIIYGDDAESEEVIDSSEARTFFDCAEESLVGFDRPENNMNVQLRMKALPFYDATDLVEFLDRRAGFPRRALFLAEYNIQAVSGKHYTCIWPIDWKSETIRTKNLKDKIDLSLENMPSYLKFFCESIVGGSGYFKIIESDSDLKWIFEDDTYEKLRSLNKNIKFLLDKLVSGEKFLENSEIFGMQKNSDKFSMFAAYVVYDRSLFLSIFLINCRGEVHMIEDCPLFNGLPIVPETITAKTHTVYIKKKEARDART